MHRSDSNTATRCSMMKPGAPRARSRQRQVAQRLILGRRGHLPANRELGEELGDLSLAQLPGMAFPMKYNESPDPVNIRLFCLVAHVTNPYRLPYGFQKSGFSMQFRHCNPPPGECGSITDIAAPWARLRRLSTRARDIAGAERHEVCRPRATGGESPCPIRLLREVRSTTCARRVLNDERFAANVRRLNS